MNYWDRIFDNLSLPTTTMCYIGIGSAMGSYDTVTEQNNQQYPCFLKQFTGKHLVILIDPLIETDLKLLNYFEQSDPLVLINQINIENTSTPYVREYTNEKGSYFVINDCFHTNIPHPMGLSEVEQEKQIEKANQNIATIYQIISIALGKLQPSKIIYQNYSGYDTTSFYISLFDVFDQDILIKNVCFDVTQLDGGCFIDFKPDMIVCDIQQNFIQEKYEKLIKFPNSPKYYNIIKTRIDNVSYPLVWNYIKLKESKDFEQIGLDKIKLLASIYQVEFDTSSKNYKYIMSRYNQLIDIVIRDIVMSRDIDDSLVDYLLANLENRTEFINSMSVLKFE